MSEKDIKRLRWFLRFARRAALAGDYERERAYVTLAGRLVYTAAWRKGLTVRNTDTNEKIEVKSL